MSDVRLIDANAMKEDLKNMLARVMYESDLDFDHSHAKIWTATITGIQHSIKRLDNAPTIDAVQVVRCRECVFRGQHDLCPMNVRVYMLDEAAYLDCTEDDGFCHKGAKMDGGATDG